MPVISAHLVPLLLTICSDGLDVFFFFVQEQKGLLLFFTPMFGSSRSIKDTKSLIVTRTSRKLTDSEPPLLSAPEAS